MQFPVFWASKSMLFLKNLTISVVIVVVVVIAVFFFLISLLCLLMKSKQTAVKGPTGSGRLLVTGFY